MKFVVVARWEPTPGQPGDLAFSATEETFLAQLKGVVDWVPHRAVWEAFPVGEGQKAKDVFRHA